MPIAHVKLYCAAFIVPSIAIGLHSCKKETSCEGCKENNKLPIAIAGPDQIITLPTDNVLLERAVPATRMGE